jgi:hypothetical protein
MKSFSLLIFSLLCITARAQFSAYDPFDDNSNEWIAFADDSAAFSVKNGKLDMETRIQADFINAKGGVITADKPFRTELRTSFVSGNDTLPYGLCWGATDIANYYAFYITPKGKFGFRQYKNHQPAELFQPQESPAINKMGSNWLRVGTIAGPDGKLKIALCVNELLVKTIDFIAPGGTFYGAFIGGKGHILFDDFIVYQRGARQEEFEPADLSVSLRCKFGQWHFTNETQKWSCCVQNGCRVDTDSLVTRFWYNDQRAGDYSVLVVPFDAAGDGDFFNAAQRDFTEYMRDTTDPVISVRKEPPAKTSVGNENEVVQAGEVYTAMELQGHQYIRRYYVRHPLNGSDGLMFQFIVPENSEYIATLDQLVKDILLTMESK